MTRNTLASVSLITCLAMASAATAEVVAKPAPVNKKTRSYRDIMRSVADMVNDGRAQELLQRRGLELLNVLWEDTGRWEGSSVGPNISDVTIEVQTENAKGKRETALMPVIRYPDFSDKTGDIKIDKIQLRVGNQLKGGTLETISLRKLLENPLPYMTEPERGKIKGTLLAKRDSHVLVSAQAAFLPVPKQGKATFWPVIFNYQSYKAHPAVLTILVTREGTSITVVDNARDTVGRDTWGQRLFFNQAGQRTPLTAVRLSDAQATTATTPGASGQPQPPLGDDANVLMLIQVPLKVKQRALQMAAPMKSASADAAGGMAGAQREERRSDVEAAVLGHGPELGPYTELAGLTIERDPRFPVRATIQFYQATSNGVLSSQDAKGFASQIRKVYKNADYVGSLVVPDGQRRPTQWWGVTTAPAVTWQDFAGLVERFERFGLPGLGWPPGAVAR